MGLVTNEYVDGVTLCVHVAIEVLHLSRRSTTDDFSEGSCECSRTSYVVGIQFLAG
jgi:hypothetical protein